MMGIDSGLLLIGMLLCALAIPVALVAAVYVGGRALGAARGGPKDDSARVVLDRRLATGEISAEEYYEREAVLRSADPDARRGSGRR
jgi:uncharacterized membrane protein